MHFISPVVSSQAGYEQRVPSGREGGAVKRAAEEVDGTASDGGVTLQAMDSRNSRALLLLSSAVVASSMQASSCRPMHLFSSAMVASFSSNSGAMGRPEMPMRGRCPHART
eukprot:6181819-Pleurochrysis_carterae.AAC.1